MTEYRRKPTTVKAWQYQPGAEKPAWIQNYRVDTPMGATPIAEGLGILLVPTKSGVTQNVEGGEWLVLDETFSPAVLSVVKPDAFDVAFEPIAAAEEPAVVVEEPAVVVEEKVADAAPAKAARGRGAQAVETAPETPAAEAE